MSEKALQTYAKVAKDYFGNPSSLHDYGTLANHLVQTSRTIIAELVNGEERGIFFTAGGSESNFLSLLSLARGNKHKGNHLITTEIEHPSILNAFKLLEKEGFEVSYVPVNEYGQVNLSKLEQLIKKETLLVSIGHGNSELGTVQNLKEIGLILSSNSILFHSDCVQTFGKVPIDVKDLHLDAITFSAHKIYGPKGVGGVYIRPSLTWKGILPNVTHEKGFRQGTLNVPGIAAFAEAAKEAKEEMQLEEERLRSLQTFFLSKIDRGRIILEGHPTKRLAHHLCLRIKGIEGQWVMLECNRNGLAISTGSACKVGESDPPKAMLAIGRSRDEGREMIRITFGRFTTKEDIDKTIMVLSNIIKDFNQ